MSHHLKLPVFLLVTQNGEIRQWVKKHLETNYFVIEATTKEAAQAACQNAPLNFCVVDGGLETCDALELCQTLKKELGTDRIPIFLISGKLKQTFREKALAEGVKDFLNPSLDLEEWEAKIGNAQHKRPS